MTIVVGIKAKDGAVIASDCKIVYRSEIIQGDKINSAIHFPDDAPAQISGVFFGSAGSCAYDLGLACKKVFTDYQNIADLLTNEFVLTHSVEEIAERIELLEAEAIALLHNEGKTPAYKAVRENQRYMTACRDVRSFIESGDYSPITGLDRVVIRLSQNYGPDILHIRKSTVIPRKAAVVGHGRRFVKAALAGYSGDATVDEALGLAINAMNLALERRDKFRGYELVAVKKLESGFFEIRSAIDLQAETIVPSQVSLFNYQDRFARQ